MQLGRTIRRWWYRFHPADRPFLWLIVCFLVLSTIYFGIFIDESYEPIPVDSIVIIGRDDMNGIKRNDRTFFTSTGCKIPKLETFGAELMPFIKAAEPLECLKNAKGVENWVYVDEEGKLIKRRREAKCTIEYFRRKTDVENEILKKEDVVDRQKMASDFGFVQCSHGGEKWEGPLMATIRDEKIVEKVKRKAKKTAEKPMDIVLFGFDSMSQQHFRRKMAKTVKKLEQMEAVILNGYTIVGDGTPQAFIPILTGKNELELPNTRKRYSWANYVDVYPFVWKNFSENGYVTLFGEDAFAIGMFTYRLKGFSDQPTDHYTRNFYKEVEGASTKRGCVGSDPAYEYWFRYARQFLREYSDLPRFLAMHQDSLSHNDINLIEVEDEAFSKHLSRLESDGFLDNALLIVMADHGHRFMKIRDTQQGQLEERLPMFSLTLPTKLRGTLRGKKIYENLLANRDVLTTPFDVYETLLDVLNPPEDISTPQQLKRGLSLFRPIPSTRTCENADVLAHWCSCLDWKNATLTDLDRRQTQLLAEGLAKAIDNQLENVKNLCSNVTLKKVLHATKLTPDEGVLKYKTAQDKDGFEPSFKRAALIRFAHYRLKIMTSPNDAVFEGTVYFDGRKGQLEVDLQALSHVNAYGDDPHCVVKKFNTLALYCVCHDRVKIVQ